MKKLIVSTILLYIVISGYSQIDSLFLTNYDQKILENSKLKIELQTGKKNYSDLSEAYKKDTIALLKQIKDLRIEISSLNHIVSTLNENKIIEERDNLKMKIDSFNIVFSKQIQIIAEKEKEIASEKANAKTAVNEARNAGKAEALSSIVNKYKNQPFDDLIKSSTKESVAWDMQLIGNNPEVNPFLTDLVIYFSSLELLSEKFDAVQIKNAQTKLNQIKRQSKLLETLIINLDFYQDFNTALKKTINNLANLDKHKLADGDSEIQKLKFNDIVTILTDYIYNYYDYTNYPHLVGIMIEIIKRKRPNADVDITDLLIKL